MGSDGTVGVGVSSERRHSSFDKLQDILVSYNTSQLWDGTYYWNHPWKTRTGLSFTVSIMVVGVLTMQESGHQQLWYWPSYPRILRFRHQKGYFSTVIGLWFGIICVISYRVIISGTEQQHHLLPITQGQYHDCWCPGYSCSQGINRHDTDPWSSSQIRSIDMVESHANTKWSNEILCQA